MRKSRSVGQRLFGLLFCLYSFCSLPCASAQADLEATLNAKYDEKVLTLRNFYQDDRLEYDRNGVVKGNAHTGPWTIGRVRITKIKLQANRLELDGVRVADVYDTKSSKFSSVSTPHKVRVVVDRDPQQASSLDDALSHVFLGDSDRLADLVPSCWKAFFGIEALPQQTSSAARRINESDLATAPGREEPTTVKQLHAQQSTSTPPTSQIRVITPRGIYHPDPQYVALAPSAISGGSTLLSATVTQRGTVDEVQIVRPVGMGFDDAAVEAVRKWTFTPATKNGQPVAVRITIAVMFRSY